MSRVVVAKKEHEVLYKDLLELLRKHAAKISSEEFLAVAANMLGKIIALQDQRTMTQKRAMEIVVKNLEFGNEQVIAELLNSASGRRPT